MRTILQRTGFVALGLFAAIQLAPAERTNPPVTGDVDAPPQVAAILRRACYDCHSNETHWPWYGYLAPVSWLLVRDVDAGRSELNFSKWGEYSEKRRRHKAEEAIDAVREGWMPPKGYVRMHGSAALAPAEIEILGAWSESLGG